ncbi:hypothetical protein ZYGM_004721 [Zygosaccharomyces mellis]|uniref:Vacuolar protein sorting-associated protein 52 n=1 Tax=Zygosaccharomyces mellis TaxID=42258 RepID=A0A4C2E5K8_9SACH|nr:hypothetical protein ZYGM_004721 [Zygosaccharomyces mellis]
MDALSSVLGTNVNSFDPSDNPREADHIQVYLEDSKDPKLQINNNLWNELEKLQEKQKQIRLILETTVPPLREYMERFNSQLSEFTSDLGHIRNKSTELKYQLEYNSTRLAKVSPLVNDLMIPPSIINSILHDKINATWQENIAFMRDKQEIYDNYKESTATKPRDFELLYEVLSYLKKVILDRSRKFIIHCIKKLRSHQPIASQRIQENLLQVRDIFQYIVENNYSLALELRQAYAYTLRWYYKEYFGRYVRSLTILPFKNIDSQYSLGNSISSVHTSKPGTSMFSNYFPYGYSKNSGPVAAEVIQDYFQISKRLSILTQEDNTVMVSQIAENNIMSHHIEIGFKNLNLAVLDNCSVELEFLKNFFGVNSNEHEFRGILEQIFQPTFLKTIEYTRQLIQYTFDIFGVLMCIRIAQQLQFESERRQNIVTKDNLTNHLMLLWPKFQQLIDFQCESLHKIPMTAVLARSLNTSQRNPLTTPLELTIQFSRFLTSLLTLACTHRAPIDERSEPLYNSIFRLRNDFETVMTKCSKKTNAPERMLATNYMFLYSTLEHQNLNLQGKADRELPSVVKETEDHFKALVEALSRVT